VKPAGKSSESLIEFPSELSIKAMGLATADFQSLVESLVISHLVPQTDVEVTTLPSSKGKYVSVRVKFVATSRAQLESIYKDLHASEQVLFTM